MAQIVFNTTDEAVQVIATMATRYNITQQEAATRVFAFGLCAAGAIVDDGAQIWLTAGKDKLRIDQKL